MAKNALWIVALLVGWGLARVEAGPGAPATAGPADFADAAEIAGSSIVHVATQLPGHSRDDAVGSGFVLSSDGLIATSRHVLAGAQNIMVHVPGHGPVAAQVLGHDEAVDVTVLRVPFAGLLPLAVGSSRGLRPGQWVLACGSPYGLERSWSAGIVSGLHRRGVAARPGTYEDFIQSDAAANLGNSGGPLLDTSGRVVGMVTQILTRAGGFQGVSLATPIEAVLEAAERITKAASGGTIARPTLGVMVREVASGLEITRVPAGSPAQTAGLRSGDVLLAVEGADARTAAALARALWGRSSGQHVTLRLLRGPSVMELVLPLR